MIDAYLIELYDFCHRNGLAVTRAGRIIAHDPRYILDLCKGRVSTPETRAKMRERMTRYEAAHTTPKAQTLPCPERR